MPNKLSVSFYIDVWLCLICYFDFDSLISPECQILFSIEWSEVEGCWRGDLETDLVIHLKRK